MTNTEVRVIKLSCVSCGSTLDISQSMNKLACGHCGTSQIVERSGGAIHLRGVAETLSKVQIGTDRTAAELAIARLSKELEAVRYQRSEKEQYWLNIRTKKLYDWNALLEGKKNSVNVATLASGIVAAIPSGIIASVCYRVFCLVIPVAEKAAMPAVLIFLAGCICAAVFVRKWMRKSDNYNPEKLQKQCNKEFADLDRQIANELGEVDKKIVSLNGKLQQNYQVANN